MKLNELSILSDAIEKISFVTRTPQGEIIEALVGVCWNEEDAGELREDNNEDTN